ncbi:uncharacterized protein [Atheta coriaria]|uniref:uncharacterized protein isoform X2 n=1 Tax=Dalotia coriaria TaxID=877792 RepID=UPI0031F41963
MQRLATFVVILLWTMDWNLDNVLRGSRERKYFFLDNIERPYRILYNLATVCFLIYSGFGIMNAVFLMYCLILYLESFCNVFKNTLREAKCIKIKTIRYRKLIKAHHQHLYMTRMWVLLTHFVKWPGFVLITFSGLIIALIIITAFIRFDVLCLCHVMLYTIVVYGLGWMGERIIALGEKIRRATFYACPWDGDVKSVRILMLMNMNFNHNLSVPLGNYTSFSCTVVLSVFKFAYSIVTLYINKA